MELEINKKTFVKSENFPFKFSFLFTWLTLAVKWEHDYIAFDEY